MKIDIAELMRQKSRLDDIQSDLNGLFNNINNELENVCDNVKSTSLTDATNNLKTSIATVSNNLNTHISTTSEFMGSQLNKYQVTNEEATAALTSLVQLIDTTYDESGDINKTALATALSTTAPVTTPAVVETDVPEVQEYVPTITNPNYSGQVLTRRAGRIEGPSGQETYYNLKMDGVISLCKNLGIDLPGEYWVRDDGVKMIGDYVMVAANLDVHPRGSYVDTSLGKGIVVDTGGFAANNPTQLDIAVNW